MSAGPTITSNVAGSTEQDQRKQNLDRGPLCSLLRAQAPTRAQRVRAGVKRRRDLRAELFALDQGRGDRLDILECDAFGQVTQRLSRRDSG